MITKSEKEKAEGRGAAYQDTVTVAVSREHDDNAEFPYKDPAVRAIKAAFDAMLAKFAVSSV